MGDLKSNVLSWVEEQGYPLEMQVASSFERNDIGVSQGPYYEDPETGKEREIDVVASGGDDTGLLSIFLAVECKVSRDKPWVLFTSQNSARGSKVLSFGVMTEAAMSGLSQKSIQDLFSIPWFEKPDRTAYGVTQAFTSGADISYAALMGAAKAAIGIKRTTQIEVSGMKNYDYRFVFPVVVIDGRLFNCHMTNGSIEIEEVDHGFYNVARDIGGDRMSSVHILTTEYLGKLCEEINEVEEKLMGLFGNEIDEYWEKSKSEPGKE